MIIIELEFVSCSHIVAQQIYDLKRERVKDTKYGLYCSVIKEQDSLHTSQFAELYNHLKELQLLHLLVKTEAILPIVLLLQYSLL